MTQLLPREKIRLLENGNAAGTFPANGKGFRVYGGNYLFAVQGTLGTNVQLQYQADDGINWINLGAARTTNDGANTPSGAISVSIGSASTVQIVVTGTPTGLYCSLTRVPS